MLDNILFEKIFAGDRSAFKQIFDAHYKSLVKYANRFLNDVETSRDIVQEVYCYLWEKRKAVAIDRSMEAYLFRAVHNACINRIKKEKVQQNYIQSFLVRINQEPDLAKETINGYDYLLEKDMAEKIEGILESLPAQCSNIFKLSRYRGLKNKEIAELFKISNRTVETQIFRALKVFKEKLLETTVMLILLHIF